MVMRHSKKKSAATVRPERSALMRMSSTCPTCSHSEEHRAVKSRVFVEREKDIDMRTKSFLWVVQGIIPCHPPLFFPWHCTQCKFTASQGFFEDPAKECRVPVATLRKLYPTVKEEDAVFRAIQKLSEDLVLPEYDFVTSFQLHLLAILIAEHIDDLATRETLPLAKYYLRLAWLFRDLTEVDEFKDDKNDALNVVSAVRTDWRDVPTNEQTCLTRAAKLYENALTSSSAIETARDEVELILLLARIHLKLGDAKHGKQFAFLARDKIRKFEQENSQKIREAERAGKEIPDAERMQMGSEVRRLNLMQENVRILFDDL